MIVLGIETSCDETGVALYDSDTGLRAHALFSQVEIHAEYGGIVPEIASRDHVRKLLPLINQCLENAGLTRTDIDAVAYTAGPGLIGALLVGTATGRSIAMALGKPALAVHHMEGHLLAPMLEADPPEVPVVALLVSGVVNILSRSTGLPPLFVNEVETVRSSPSGRPLAPKLTPCGCALTDLTSTSVIAKNTAAQADNH